jgi:alanine dehydrogenase
MSSRAPFTSPASTRLFNASAVERLIQPLALIDAVERAFASRGTGKPQPGGVLGIHADHGGFHIKAAALSASSGLLAAKLNANFPQNRAEFGLPTIQGVVIVSDVRNGSLRALVESGSLTRLRTAAASAVAIRHLANAGANELVMVGCGVQAFDQVRFARAVRPLQRVWAHDLDATAAGALAERLERELGVEARVATDLHAACATSAIIITCTTSRTAFLKDADVASGAVVIAAGADSETKHEIEPALMARAKVVTDDSAQCAQIGDLHHAIAAGAMRIDQVHAELGAVVARTRPGRTSADERFVFDSTGTPIQDAAAVELLLEASERDGTGTPHFDFRGATP